MRLQISMWEGIERSAIIMPGGPAVSPTANWMPNLAQMCMSALW